jgi:iron-sulfur cluster repair protein YtfE (RIC family)
MPLARKESMNPIAARLTKDHQEIDALLRRVAEDAAAPVPGALTASWGLFETKLIRHMEAEERFLLPLLEASDPVEVSRIRNEHMQIREALTELGMAVELHTAREPHFKKLVDLLETHGKHEDAALYRLAGDKASSSIDHGVAQLLKQGATTLLKNISDRIF